MSGLFSTFNIAKRGMSAQQMALDVTSHNIANVNTNGYSRQRANMETTSPFGMPSMNNAIGPGQLGTGVQVSSITRIRDSYLDYRVREQNGNMGLYQGREKFLSEVEGIFNELDDTGISKLVDKVFNSWQDLSKSPEVANTRNVVAQQSKALTDELNSSYNQLVKLKENSQDVIKQDVVDINNMLDQINELNKQVMGVKNGGNEPNDLMDKRDLLVDQLSVKFGITIDKKTLGGEDLKPTETGDMENACLIKSNPNDEVRRFSYVNSIVPSGGQKQGEAGTYEVTYYKNGDTTTDANKVTMTMTLSSDEYKKLDQGRVVWADKEGYAIDKAGNKIAGTDSNGPVTGTQATMEKIELFQPKTGELNGYMSVQADIDVYIEQLNSLAKGIALSVNAVHSGESDASKDTLKFFVNADGGSEEEITAGNISVNKEIINDVMKIKVGKGDNPEATDGNRALAIANLRNVKLDIQSINSKTTRAGVLGDKMVFDAKLGVNTISSSSNGMTISGFFANTVLTLAGQKQTATRNVTNNMDLLASLEQSRSSVSGVSLDEEMANMIQYQHAYQANAKIISTVDELLDLIINGLKK